MAPSKTELQYQKMTETPVAKLLVSLAAPAIVTMLISSFYSLVDSFFVGKIGTSASAATGIVFSFMTITQAIGFMFGHGSGSILSRRLGEQKQDAANRVASTGFFATLLFSLLMCIIGLVFAEPLVYLLGSTDTIAPYAVVYMRCILLGAPFSMLSFVLNNLLRYEGKAALGMYGILSGTILNMGLDALFIMVFHWGIAGAGIATALSNLVSFLALFSMYLRGKTQCQISFKNAALDWALIGDICGTGLPSLLRQALASVTTVALNWEANPYGDEAVAAMTIVGRITMFIFSFALGIGQGGQPIFAFNYGARKYSRVRSGYKVTLLVAEIAITLASIAVFIFAPDLIWIMRNDQAVVEIGTRALRLMCVAQVTVPVTMVTEMVFQATGKKLPAVILSSLRGGVIFLPAIFILAALRGLAGIQEAQPLAYVLTMLPAIILAANYFRKLPKEGEENAISPMDAKVHESEQGNP